MKVKAAFVAVLAITAAGVFAPRAEAAPLPTNVAAMKAALNRSVVQVRYGYRLGGGGYRGVGGYRGWGHRGWGYRGWGLGAAAAGAVVGGAIASSAYYDTYPYYGGADYGYANGYSDCSCPTQGYAGYYPGYRARYYSW